MATHRQLMTILNQLGIDNDARHDLIYDFTEGRTQSSRDLTDRELEVLIQRIKAPVRTMQNNELELALRHKRSIVLTIATRTGIKDKDNWFRFNKWMEKSSVLKKSLYKYSLTDLDLLILQFRGIERNYKLSAANPGTKAWYYQKGFQEAISN